MTFGPDSPSAQKTVPCFETGVRERDTQKEIQTEREKDTDRERQGDREVERDTEREKER